MNETIKMDTVVVSAATALPKLKGSTPFWILGADLMWRFRKELHVLKAILQWRLAGLSSCIKGITVNQNWSMMRNKMVKAYVKHTAGRYVFFENLM